MDVDYREIEEADAGAFVELLRALDEETSFMLFSPGERRTTEHEQLQRIRAMRTGGPQMVVLALQAGRLIGFAAATHGTLRRNRHTATCVVGVVRANWRNGVGGGLLDVLAALAAARDVHRLELTVMAHNQGAIALYNSRGFALEGRRIHALRVDDDWVDELVMARLLERA